MKTTLFCILILLLFNKGFSQKQIEPNINLINFYSPEYINQLKQNNSDLILYLNYYSTKGFIIENTQKDVSTYPNINEFKRGDLKNKSEEFNILEYYIQISDKPQYFTNDKIGRAHV